MQRHHATATLILAAGSSSRMGAGRHKLLLPLGDRSVLAHVIDTALASQARPIVIVLGHQALLVRASLTNYTTHPTITMIDNPDYLQGMSTSLQIGLQTLINTPSPHTFDSVIIMLGDQPLITPHIIDTLLATKQISQKRIVTPLYHGKRGNPIVFDASLFPELMEVTGDEGGRSVIERHRQELVSVELGDAVANYDVDTWEAYQEVVEEWIKTHE